MSAHRGTVTQIAPDGRPMVEVPDLGAGYTFGPLDVYIPYVTLEVGARVVVTSVGGIRDDLVVIGAIVPPLTVE